MTTSPTIKDRISGGLLGMLVGDALGVPYEFRHPSTIPEYEFIEMEPPASFHRAHVGTPPGTWSDDGSQALCLAKSLIEVESLNLDDFGNKLVLWLNDGYMAVDQRVFDCGHGSREAIGRIKEGTPAIDAGGKSRNHSGNGALMRVLPLALWHQGSIEELIRDAHLQSRVTHATDVAQACCAYYCIVARAMLCEYQGDPWDFALKLIQNAYAGNESMLEALATIMNYPERHEPAGSGYIVDQIWTARHAMQMRNYEAVVKAAIQRGHDTDTSACISGGLAGIREGIQGIPDRWLTQLREKEIPMNLAMILAERWGAHKPQLELPPSAATILTSSKSWQKTVTGFVKSFFR